MPPRPVMYSSFILQYTLSTSSPHFFAQNNPHTFFHLSYLLIISPIYRFARNEMKTIIAVLITQFDLAIVDPPGITPPKDNIRGVFDTREPHGPGINEARAGG